MSTDESITSTPVEYRFVDGDPGYRAGNDGSVWSCLIRANREDGRRGSISIPGPTWRRLETDFHGRKRLSVRIRGKTRSVHRLVLEAFVGTCPPGLECCHHDGNPTNNRLDNLRWDTRLSNNADKVRHGTQMKGEKHSSAKLNAEKVRAIRAEFARGGISSGALGARYGVGATTVRNIINQKIWTHVE